MLLCKIAMAFLHYSRKASIKYEVLSVLMEDKSGMEDKNDKGNTLDHP